MRLDLFKLRSLATANGVMLLVFSGMFAMFFFCTLYLQKVLGYSALETGVAFLPVSVGIVIGSVLAQQLIGRLGTKRVLATGTTLAAVGLAMLAATTSVDGTYLELLAALAPLSIGMGLTFVPLTLVATTNVAKEDAGLASGVFNTSQQVGGALGLAVLSTFANDRTASALADGAQQSAALVDGFQLAFVIAAGLVGRRRGRGHRPCCDAATSPGSTRATWTWPRRPRKDDGTARDGAYNRGHGDDRGQRPESFAPTPSAIASGSSPRRSRSSPSAASTPRRRRSPSGPGSARRPCSAASRARTTSSRRSSRRRWRR